MDAVINKIAIVILTIVCCLCYSCSKDDFEELGNNPSDEQVVEAALNKASLSWNSSVEQIKKQMNGYTIVEQSDDFLQFTNPSNVLTISYGFVNDSLRATVTMMPKLLESDMSSYLNGYTYLAELSSKNVYYNESVNSMCFSYETSDDNVEYTVLGFTPIESDLYTSVNPIIVTTIEAVNIGTTYSTIKGSISGVTKSYTCGVKYSTDSSFSSSKTKTTTSKDDYSVKITSLKRNTTYYFQCYAVVDGISYFGETMTFTTLE